MVCHGHQSVKVLNVVSKISCVGIDRMPLLEIQNDLDSPSKFNECQEALQKLKLWKSDRVTPKMLMFGGTVLHKVLLKLFQRFWSKC